MKPLPWSFSALNKFDTCPKQFYEVRVTKRWKEEQGEAALWGDRVHKSIESAVKDGTPLDPEVAHVQPLVDMVRDWASAPQTVVLPEVKLGLNKNGQACSFFDRDVFGRAIADILAVRGAQARVLDWKTGKRKPSDQLLITSLMVFQHYPEVERITTDFVWIKANAHDRATYTREQIPEMWAKVLPLLREYKDAFKSERFIERPSGLCKGWCPVQDCKFWSKKR